MNARLSASVFVSQCSRRERLPQQSRLWLFSHYATSGPEVWVKAERECESAGEVVFHRLAVVHRIIHTYFLAWLGWESRCHSLSLPSLVSSPVLTLTLDTKDVVINY